jgi:tight adherence protein C
MPSIMNVLLPILAGFMTFFAIFLLVIRFAGTSWNNPVEQRLRDVTDNRTWRSDQAPELQAPFAERFFKPLANRISRLVARVTPDGLLASTQKRLTHAGYEGRMQVSDFLGIKGLAALVGAGIAMLIVLSTTQDTVLMLVLMVAFGGLGFYLPDLWLSGQITRRKDRLTRELPDTIDLLTISVEAGLGFDQAVKRVVMKSDTMLSREFDFMLRQLRLNVSRHDALLAMVERTGVEDISVFVSAVLQAEQLGSSIAKVLRIQSEEMRRRRRQRAETLARTAPIKMLFPMAFLIFPPIFIVVLGPAIPRIIHAFVPDFPL